MKYNLNIKAYSILHLMNNTVTEKFEIQMNECKKEFVFENKNSVIWVVYFFNNTNIKLPIKANSNKA